jgi:two-component system response regulator AtoC
MKDQKGFKIFIVEDDLWYSSMLEYYLAMNPDYSIEKFNTAKSFLNKIHEKPQVITLDYSLPDSNGDQLLAQIKEISPESKVIVISGQEDVKVALNLLKKGAYDYLVKDDDTKERLWNIINNLRENIEIKTELETLKKEVVKKYDFNNAILGNSPGIKRVFNLMEKAAKTNITISITGETGTGKELVAKSIHYNSPKKDNPFVTVNVAAIPRDLIESELFGHEKGAFTSAITRRIGKFEEAHNGTLFLDEIGEMEINMQAKLLRVLQEKEVSRIGSNEIIKVDARIIVATHRNLQEMVKNGTFREDLYYRLLGLPIHLPALRERENDAILIAKHYIDIFCTENKLPSKNLTTEAKKKIMGHAFPGNIRELKSVIELACVLSEGNDINEEHLNVMSQNVMTDFIMKDITLKEFNNKLIQYYLDKYNYDVLKVAKKLDIGKSTIYRMIQNKDVVVNKSFHFESIF